MDRTFLKIKLKEFLTNSRTEVSLLSSSQAREFGLVSLLWFSSRSIYLSLALGSLDFFRISAVYRFTVLFFVVLLGFGVRVLCDIRKVKASARSGCCSECSSKNQSCIGVLRILKTGGNGDHQEEEGDATESGCDNAKGKKDPIVGGSHTGFRSHGVCCIACESEIQSSMGFQCERRRRMQGCLWEISNDIGGQEREYEEEEEKEGDVMSKLKRELVKERKVRAWTEMELEKERRAASSAADEAMAKILLLQNEKGLVEREARQYREMMEQKRAYDEDVIENLKWIILNLQEEKIGSGNPIKAVRMID